MNKMSYKTTENDSEYVQVDPNENNPNVEAPKEKVVYDASIVRMLKDTTEMHLKYYRESSKLGPNSIGSKCARTNSVGPSEKEPKSKTTTNQVQVQVLNAPYVISNDGSSSIGEDSTNRSSYVVFFCYFLTFFLRFVGNKITSEQLLTTNHTQISGRNMEKLKQLSNTKTSQDNVIMNRMKTRSTYGQLEYKDHGNTEGF
jgi:hypothetical protein